MSEGSQSPVPFITAEATLRDFLAQCPSGVPCCVDTEADSLYSYREKICLIQFACADHIALIDPLTIKDQTLLLDFLDAAPEVWMHGADYDMSILNRTYGRVPDVVFDTQIAARLIGWRTFGLAHLIKDLMGVELSKQSQKKNWGERPLPEKMLAYAANDVRYLMPIIEIFKERLDKLGRWDWFLQSCAAARTQVLGRPEKSREESWRIPGWGKISSRGLAYLREIWRWRDGIASRRDKPPFKIISNDQLISMSVSLSAGKSVSLPPRFRQSQQERFEEGVAIARALPEADLPKWERKKRLSKAGDWERVFQFLRQNRENAAEELDIEAALISSKASLERYAFSESEDRTPELRGTLFLPWQQSLLFPEVHA
ncbi:MAG: ribonuclease D [Verrucomicrobiales bacterium]|jgi:ribonuclease D